MINGRKIGLSMGSSRIGSQALFDAYAKAGLDCAEVCAADDAYDSLDYPGLKVWSEKAGVQLWSYHLPFWPFKLWDPSSLDEEKRVRTVAYHKSLIDKAAAIGIRLFVVHASAEPIAEEERPARLEQAKKSMAELAEYAAGFGATVAVEDLPRTCLGRDSSDVLELISADDRLRVCFDTNHLLTEDPVHFVEAVGDKIVTLHVSDFDLVNERHWLPGEGVIDWKALVDALERVGYQGPWLYEIGVNAPWSITRRPLTEADFVDNARAILNRRQPPIFSHHEDDLPMWEPQK